MEQEKVKTKLTDTLGSATLEERYDAQCKILLSEKPILARIMQGCMEEYKNCSIEEIESCIEGKPSVSAFSLHQNGKTIRGLNTEDNALGEGTIYYDIRFSALVPSTKEAIELIINVEAQNRYNPGYPLVKRGVYYASRLISAQYGTEFSRDEYGKLKKVYSVWICTTPPKSLRNTIVSFGLGLHVIAGNVKEEVYKKQDYDLFSVIFVNLDKRGGGENKLLKLLNLLLLGEMKAFDKCKTLEEDFGIEMAEEISKEVVNMCNLSAGVLERGYKKGITQGISQGISQGKATAKIESARNAIALGLSIEMASKITGLSIQEIQDNI